MGCKYPCFLRIFFAAPGYFRLAQFLASLPSLPLWPEREAKMSDYNDYMELKKYYFEYLAMGIMTPEIKQLYWRSLKGSERSSRCRLENGTRCTASCRNCPKQREGAPLSLDALSEIGTEATDVFSLEDHIIELDLSEALNNAISTLSEQNRSIIILFSEGVTERVIAAEVGMSQKGVNNRIHKIIDILRESLKDFF